MEMGMREEKEMERIVLKDEGEIDAREVILRYGFKDTTPFLNPLTKRIFEKDGKKYRFVGWHHPYTGFSRGRTWEDVELEEI